jgi:hypothetical protein
VHRRTPIDVFVYEPFDFAHEFSRALRLPVFGNELAPILQLDELVELKRSAGRGQDLVDIEKLTKLEMHRKNS